MTSLNEKKVSLHSGEKQQTAVLESFSISSLDEDTVATEEQIATLRHVPDSLPLRVWAVAAVGTAERFTYYAITAPFQNYMQNPHGESAVPGALGLGQSKAVAIYNAFAFFSFITPTFFAIVSDVWLGRYATLLIALTFYFFGALIMTVVSIPSIFSHDAAVGGLAISMVLVGLAAGGVKATFPPLLGDQYTKTKLFTRRLKSGELVVVDRALTISYIYNLSYWLTNIAALSSIPTTFLERHVGYWAAFLLPLWASVIGLVLYVVGTKTYVRHPPAGNILPTAGKVLACAAKGNFKIESARPAYQLEHFGRQVPWTDDFVDEIRRGLIGCRVIFSFIIFYLCITQMTNNLISQAGQMRLHGVPNDAIPALNCIACVIIIPLLQKGLYPFLAKRKIPFGPVARITAAFILAGIGMGYSAGVQKLIYDAGPCYDRPLACEASEGGRISNDVNVWIQTPVYVILAFAEIFGFVAASEIAYSQAPKSMKALVQSLTQLTAAGGSALGMAISPVAVDPHLVVMYASLAGVQTLWTVPFFLWFHQYDQMLLVEHNDHAAATTTTTDQQQPQPQLQSQPSQGTGTQAADEEKADKK